MQEFFLNLKPRHLKLFEVGWWIVSATVIIWPTNSVAEKGQILCIMGIPGIGFHFGWHYSIGKYLLDQCEADLDILSRLYTPITIFTGCYLFLMSALLAIYAGEILEQGDGNIMSIFWYIFPVHMLAVGGWASMDRTEAHALLLAEDRVLHVHHDPKKTKRHLGGFPFGQAKIQRRVQAIRDKDPMRAIYLSDHPNLPS